MPEQTGAQSLTILCTLGMRDVLVELAPQMAAKGFDFIAHYESTNALMRRIAGGAQADVAIMIDAAITELAAQGKILRAGTRQLARTGVALAVRSGASKPDISTVERLRQTLLAARSIAYTESGASGIHFAAVIERLGIAEEIRRKAAIRDGFTGELAASGEVEIAVQQMSELMPVAGIDIIGPLPGPLQQTTVFSAGVFASSKAATSAKALIDWLASAEAEKTIRQKGLEPTAAFV